MRYESIYGLYAPANRARLCPGPRSVAVSDVMQLAHHVQRVLMNERVAIVSSTLLVAPQHLHVLAPTTPVPSHGWHLPLSQ
jgi:hypothetical protein